MAIPSDKDARLYYRVAEQRLEDGVLLLTRLDRPRAAIYLAGYATECILKALLLVVTPLQERRDVLLSFRGAAGHDFDWLRRRVSARGTAFPAGIHREIIYLSTWSVDMRYQPGEGDRADAGRFIKSTQTVLKWADGRI